MVEASLGRYITIFVLTLGSSGMAGAVSANHPEQLPKVSAYSSTMAGKLNTQKHQPIAAEVEESSEDANEAFRSYHRKHHARRGIRIPTHFPCPEVELGSYSLAIRTSLEWQKRNWSIVINDDGMGCDLLHPGFTARPSLRDKLLTELPETSILYKLQSLGLTSRSLFLLETLESFRVSDKSHEVFSYAHCSGGWASLALLSRLNQHYLLQHLEKHLKQISDTAESANLRNNINNIASKEADQALSPESRYYLRKIRLQLENQLVEGLPQFRAPLIEVEEVSQSLPQDGVLVEFQRYKPYDARRPEQGRWGEHRYLALVLKPTGAISTVDLGVAEKIDQAVAAMLTATKENIDDPPALLAKVRALVIDPVRPYMGDARQWFLSPDAQLSLVPFAALPTGGGGTLAEERDLRLLTTGRELLALQKPSAKRGAKPLVLADPDFGEEGDWRKLPASALEGMVVAKLLGTEPLLGKKASASALMNARGPWVVHLATHAYALQPWGSNELFVNKQFEQVPAMSPYYLRLLASPRFNPLLNSVIVLAGANNDIRPTLNSLLCRPTRDDGYLTAKEVTGLELDGTEMVVLSACDTAIGKIQSGEGVYGLQWALSVAGARSTMLSLWKVSDLATREFMTRYYTLLLKEGKGRAEALRQVQKEFRNHHNSEFRSPYFWAAWQLVGDWRPLGR